MDKHDIYIKGTKNIIWPILRLKEFFEVVPNGTTQGYFCLQKRKFSKKKGVSMVGIAHFIIYNSIIDKRLGAKSLHHHTLRRKFVQ
jgi:hypothetical protein